MVTSNSMLIVAGCYPCAKCANRPSNKARPNGRIAKRPKGAPFGRISKNKNNPRAPRGAKERQISTTVPDSEALAGSGRADGLFMDLGLPPNALLAKFRVVGASSLPSHFELALRRSDCMASSRACINLTSGSTNESAARTMTLSFVRIPWFVEAYPLNCRSFVKSSGYR